MSLTVKYLGLTLRNPLIVGSCGLTGNLKNIREYAEMGAGAVVLKSVFEEQIRMETEQFLKSDHEKLKEWTATFDAIVSGAPHAWDEAEAYIANFAKEHTLKDYLEFVREAKQTVDIPVIASIHCVSKYDWTYFARRIQEAGADALELNIYVLPSDFNSEGVQNEQVYFDILKEVKKHLAIPVALKIGSYFSGLAFTLKKLSEAGADALVLFNKPYNPDIDIHKLALTASDIYSGENQYQKSLRWIASLSGVVSCDLAASTGILNAETAIKQLLAGADAFQIASALYKHGAEIIPQILGGIESWMAEKNFSSVADFKGMLGKSKIEHPVAYDRVQFMKHYAKIE
ncbi:MAG TPA: dihydroorotate dehydrogenase-like protein [Prolixibacteraceae bacterium]|nr:dihydroorotate dehydrogenase-like protein [Prolixibacteraceae bacterium]